MNPPPAFILGAHKSGTSLLRSLLDGHPRLAVLPKESHAFQFTGHAVSYALRRCDAFASGGAARVDRLLGQVRVDARGGDPYSDAPEFAGYDMALLEGRLRQADPDDTGALIRAYLPAAYEAATGLPPPAGATLVEKSVEHAEFAERLAAIFPGARFIHVVRHPCANLVAIRRMLERRRGRYPGMRRAAQALRQTHALLVRNREAIPNYRVLRFEDLVEDAEPVMRTLASFLGVEFDDVLLRPTQLGRPWGGNSTGGTAFAGISRQPLDGWREDVNDFEAALAAQCSAAVFDAFGYDRPLAPHPLRRARGERLRTWAGNRLLLYGRR